MKKDQLKYKRYYGSINLDSENNLLYGKVEYIRALITYEAKDVEGLMKAFRESVEDYLKFCCQKNIEPEKPFKGSLNIRIGEARHRQAAIAAQSLEKSLNDYICQALDEKLKTESINPGLTIQPKIKAQEEKKKSISK